MAILAECPICGRRQKLSNKVCVCGENLDKAKRSGKIEYWTVYRAGGKQKWELVGDSIEKARDAEGKRRSQKREGRIFDIKRECKMTFEELAKWYLNLERVKVLSSYWHIQTKLDRFNAEFGKMIVSEIKPSMLENYQAKRKAQKRADATIDQEIKAARTMVKKAFFNGLVGGDTHRTFQAVKNLLRPNSNARKRILTPEEYSRLWEVLPLRIKGIFATAYYTGMREGEILNLTWDKVSLKDRSIKLESGDTKDKEPRVIPICDELHDILKRISGNLNDTHVFLDHGQPIKNFYAGLKAACEKAGIPYGRFTKDGFVFHDLRHTFNTYMRKAGVQESVIMEITGHSTREMFDRYNTVDLDDKKEAVKRFEGYLASVSRPLAENWANA
jgi:integrase